MQLKIADINIELQNLYPEIEELAGSYKTENAAPELVLQINTEDIELERKISGFEVFSDSYLETVAVCRKLADRLSDFEALLLHSAVFEVEGRAIALAARSGTGKTTHMRLWKNMLRDKMTVINGDKPIIRFLGDTPFAFGTPWNGKENLGENRKAPLADICFIERSEKNSCEEIKAEEIVDLIFNQVYMPKSTAALMKTMELIDKMLSSVRLWKIRCNMNPEAAKTAFDKIFKGE